MNLSTIEMDRTKAKEAFLGYRQLVQDRHDKELEEIMRGYKALSQGKQLISLQETLLAGGVDEGLPRLAACRANAQWCYLMRSGYRGPVRFTDRVTDRANFRWGAIPAPKEFQEGLPDDIGSWRESYKAMVPIIPPQYRPNFGLHNYHVLWEADWEKSPPKDPALLKHIGGDLYAVLAVWDLTELERLVLAGRKE